MPIKILFLLALSGALFAAPEQARAADRRLAPRLKACVEQPLAVFVAQGRPVPTELFGAENPCDGQGGARAVSPRQKLSVAAAFNLPGSVDLDLFDALLEAQAGRHAESFRRIQYSFVSPETMAGALRCAGWAAFDGQNGVLFFSSSLLTAQDPASYLAQIFGGGFPPPPCAGGRSARASPKSASARPETLQDSYERRRKQMMKRHDAGPMDEREVFKVFKKLSGAENRLPPHALARYAGSYDWPLRAGIVSSEYGFRRSRMHHGIDIAADLRQPVLASADGVVIFAGQMSGYGNVIIIQHDQQTVTLYAHNLVNHVGRGQSVRAGDAIALLGSTGRSTGPHVHFEIRTGGRSSDPRRILPRARL